MHHHRFFFLIRLLTPLDFKYKIKKPQPFCFFGHISPNLPESVLLVDLFVVFREFISYYSWIYPWIIKMFFLMCYSWTTNSIFYELLHLHGNSICAEYRHEIFDGILGCAREKFPMSRFFY